MSYDTILVTGANRGIGFQFVIELLKQNPSHLIATARDVSKATELNELASKHSNLHVLQLEVTDYSRYDSLVNEVDQIVGDKGLQLLVQNAGIGGIDNLNNPNVDSFIKAFEVNSIAPILLTHKFLPLLKKSTATGARTVTLFITSLLGSLGRGLLPPPLYSYRMSKCALNQGVRTLAWTQREEKIEFILFHPGHVATDLGGAHGNAPVKKVDAVQGILKHLENRELTNDGRPITYDGHLIPW